MQSHDNGYHDLIHVIFPTEIRRFRFLPVINKTMKDNFYCVYSLKIKIGLTGNRIKPSTILF